MAQTCLWIVLLPFVAFLIQVFLGKRLPRHGDFVSVLAIFASFCLAAPLFFAMLSTGNVADSLSYNWISLPGFGKGGAGPFTLVVGTLVNNLTAIMLFMVSMCSTLIHLFATGYMHGEDRYHLFFAYISLFSAAMLGLVVSDNLLTFFICWELMGLCSYLLIGFYYQKPSANAASLKAFMTTRIGDVCFFLGICGLYTMFGTSNFVELYKAVGNPALQAATFAGFPALTFIGLMLMMGTIGKSAQFPLHVWLPDAMEGPTPVSALIHAATMVAAGVFLLIRMYPLLEATHGVLTVVAYVGAITAFFAATIAIVQVDIKKVLAYSTISQLGFMVMGAGVGAFAAAFMHLLTHACFKACLFLSSGSVIHSVHTQDMREMGGLRTKMPWTFAAMMISTLAISGLPFFSGFVSKDRILAGALLFGMENHAHVLIPILGFTAAGITAFYMFRLMYMTFFGHARDEHKHHHAHEQPLIMVAPLIVLATLSFAIFWAGPTGIEAFDKALVPVHWYDNALENVQKQMGVGVNVAEEMTNERVLHRADVSGAQALAEAHEERHHLAHHLAMILSLCIAALGILISSLTYFKHVIKADRLRRVFNPVYTVLWNLYYFDFVYVKIIVQGGLLNFNVMLAKFDDKVIDGIFVDGWAKLAMMTQMIVGKFDEIVVDRLMVDGTGNVASMGGWFVRRFQTGRVQQYLILSFVALGVVFWILR